MKTSTHIWTLLALALVATQAVRAQDSFIRMNGPYGGRPYHYIITNEDIAYAVTPNFDAYRSTDEGRTWSPLATIADTTTPQWIERIAADSTGRIYVGGDFGIWRSTDRGGSWKRTDAGLPSYSDDERGPKQISNLEANTAGTLVARFYWPDRDSAIFRSTDQGESWSEVEIEGAGGISTVVSTHDGAFVVAAAAGLFRSDAAAGTWTRLPFELDEGEVSVELFSTRGGEIFVNTYPGRSIVRSTDGGSSWAAFTPAGLPGSPEVVSIDRTATGAVLLAISGAGVYRADVAAASFQRVADGIAIDQVKTSKSGFVLASASEPYRSGDDGFTWLQESEGLIATSVSRLEEAADGTIYAATGLRVYRSDDAGHSWLPIAPTGSADRVREVEVDAQGNVWAGVDRHGIFVSTDRGASWTPRNAGLGQITWVSEIEFVGQRGYAATGTGFFVTTDGGATWSESGTGLPSTSLTVMTFAHDGAILVGTVDAGIARSTDQGATWSEAVIGLSHQTVLSLLTSRRGTIFAGLRGGIYRSLDSGRTWTFVGRHHMTSETRGLAEAPNGTIYAGSYYIGRSTDHGLSWSPQIHVPFYNYFLVPWVEPLADGRLIFGTLGAGVGELIPDAGDRWKRMPIGGVTSATATSGHLGVHDLVATPGGIYKSNRYGLTTSFELQPEQIEGNPRVRQFAELSLAQDVMQGMTLFALTDAGLYRRSGSDAPWVLLVEGIADGTVATAMAVNQVDEVLMLGTDRGLLRSVDAGLSWTAPTTGPTGEVTSMVISGAGSGLTFAGVRGDGVYRSDDWGWNWTRVATGLPSSDVVALAVSPSGVLYAGTEGAGIWRSGDNGATWTIASPLAGRRVTSLAVNSFDVVFAGTDAGVWRSADGGTTFARVNTDHTGTVHQVYDDGRGSIRAMTDAGAFMSSPTGAVAGISPKSPAASTVALAVAGNPVRDRSDVVVHVARGGAMRLALVDLRGVERIVLHDGPLAAGEHLFALEGGQLPAGPYVLHLTGDDVESTLPVTVVH